MQQQDLDAMLRAVGATPPSPYPSSTAPSPADYSHQPVYLTSHHSPSDAPANASLSSGRQEAHAALPTGAGFPYDHSGTDFSDLLSEFATSGHNHALSPDPNRSSHGAPSPATSTSFRGSSFQDGGRSRVATADQSFGGLHHPSPMSDAQLVFASQSRAPGEGTSPSSSSGGSGQIQQLTDAVAGLDPSTKAQLLAALISNSQDPTGHSNAATPPMSETVPPRGHPDYPAQQVQPPPAASTAQSPHPFTPYSSSSHQLQQQQQQQHQQQQQQQQQAQQAALAHHYQAQQILAAQFQLALNHPLPGSPLASPYYHPGSALPSPHFPQPQYFQIDPSLYSAQHTPQSETNMTPSASTSSIAPPSHTPSQLSQPFPSPSPFPPNFSTQSNQAQPASEPQQPAHASNGLDGAPRFARSGREGGRQASSPAALSMGTSVRGESRVRGASSTGASYATTGTVGSEWGDDFMFSPLMSPAITPHSTYSTYTAASSLPPSASSFPTQAGISTGEFFPPLGSPAISTQSYPVQYVASPGGPSPHANHSHSNSLQGLVDQTRALGFDPQALPSQPVGGIASTSSSVPTAGTQQTASASTKPTGGRRGAGGSKKARPSPLLKPADTAIRRQKSVVEQNQRRSASLSSSGARSTTTSPHFGPTQLDQQPSPAGAVAPPMQGVVRTSPSCPSAERAATTSPADIPMLDTSMEFMPPPIASFSAPVSRRTSLSGGQSVVAPGGWMNPVTPASFMNFGADITDAGLMGSRPGSNDVTTDDSQATAGPTPNRPKGKKVVGSKPPLVRKQSSQNSASSTSTIKGTANGSKNTSPNQKGRVEDAYGRDLKGGESSMSGNGKKLAAKPPSTSKDPGEKPALRPLLAPGASPDALARLSTKSNYENIKDGRGDLLGLDMSQVSALPAASSATSPEIRKTSHKAAEQKRRDALKMCFDELRRILPPISMGGADEDKRPGEGNVGGHRGGAMVDPQFPNKSVSKIALLRRSNEYVGMLHDRIDRRDVAIEGLRASLREARSKLGEMQDAEVEGIDLDQIDKDERAAGTMAFYENLDSDEEREPKARPPPARRKATTTRRKSVSNSAAGDDDEFRVGKHGPSVGTAASRRSGRKSNANVVGMMENSDEDARMDGEESD
ncbi:hypothetical protein T439DRAFT_328203 [Meredithblackwellia eburnea MCA 4105]